MENFDFDYYIYTYMDRIVRIVKTKRPYEIVRFGGVKTYTTNRTMPGTTSELLYKYNYSMLNGFYLPQESYDEKIISILKNLTIKIVFMEKFNAASEVLKYTIIKRTADEDIYNRILMHQVDSYEKNGDIGSLLEAEFKCSKFEKVDSYVESIKLKYSDASEILAFIRYKTFEISELLNEDNFEAADKIINEIYQKYAL
jgi:hypothetical protein